MGDNRAQYAVRDRSQQERIQYMQNGKLQSGSIQSGSIQSGGTQSGKVRNKDTRYMQGDRPQNNRTQHTRGRAMSEKEQLMRLQQQQIQQQQKALKRRMGVLSFLMCILLLLNVVTAVSMHFRMQRVKETLRILESQLSIKGVEGNMDEAWASSGTQAGSGSFSMTAGGQTASNSGVTVTGQDYVNLCGLEYVDRPQERTMKQVMDRLNQLAKDDQRIAEILENSYKYPDKLLEALANNPEMTDFVMGYENNAGKVSGFLTQDEIKQDFPLFLQWDPRWGYGEYGDGSNIALAGCGPTCLSMVLNVIVYSGAELPGLTGT